MKQQIRTIVWWVSCLFLRFFTSSFPGVEPLLCFQMPVSKRYGAVAGFVFAFTHIVVFDAVTNQVNPSTLLIAVLFGAMSFFGKYLGYLVPLIAATVCFDALTGLGIGPLFYGQPFSEALIGQIPFTCVHVLGNVFFAMIIGRFLVDAWSNIQDAEHVSHRASEFATNRYA